MYDIRDLCRPARAAWAPSAAARRRRGHGSAGPLVALPLVLFLSPLLWAPAAMSGAPAGYPARVEPLSDAVKAEMRQHSWRPGCPVALEDLRLLTLPHHDFTGGVQVGELVVHKDVAADVVRAFAALYAARFPIEKMRRVDHYGGSDALSMEDNNTSAFNCRPVQGRARGFSRHAYGVAVDINPRTNPYVKRDEVEPPSGRAFLDRTQKAPGLIRRGDACERAFSAIGWRWGGRWRTLKDYQHFEARRLPARSPARPAPPDAG